MTMAMKQRDDQDAHKGAIEGDRPGDEQHGNPNVPALDQNGLPDDTKAIAEDRIGANVDFLEREDVANADEQGRTNDELRDELKPLD